MVDGEVKVRQGDTWTLQIAFSTNGVPIDISGYSARLQARRSDYLLCDLTSPVDLTITGPAGTVDVLVSDTVTADYPIGCYSLALEMLSPGSIRTTYDIGSLEVLPDIIM